MGPVYKAPAKGPSLEGPHKRVAQWGPPQRAPECLNPNADTNKGSTVGVNVLQKFGGRMLHIFLGAYVAYFLGGHCNAQNQVGGPGQLPGLPMLMTTTAYNNADEKAHTFS